MIWHINYQRMNMKSELYYEAHVTIEPVYGERLEAFKQAAARYGFRVAKFLMVKKRSEEPDDADSFCTARDKDYNNLVGRLRVLCRELNEDLGFVVKRYKIEDTLVDSQMQKDDPLKSLHSKHQVVLQGNGWSVTKDELEKDVNSDWAKAGADTLMREEDEVIKRQIGACL